MTVPPKPTESERLARLEVLLETLAREIGGVKEEARLLRATMNRHLIITIGVIVPIWVTIILAILFG